MLRASRAFATRAALPGALGGGGASALPAARAGAAAAAAVVLFFFRPKEAVRATRADISAAAAHAAKHPSGALLLALLLVEY